jgi:hypothetical protein
MDDRSERERYLDALYVAVRDSATVDRRAAFDVAMNELTRGGGVHRRGLFPDPGHGGWSQRQPGRGAGRLVPGRQQAPAAAIDVFAWASARRYDEIARNDPQSFRQRQAAVADEWACHRPGMNSSYRHVMR